MFTYKKRKSLEKILRKIPNSLSSLIIDVLNPIRKKYVKNNINIQNNIEFINYNKKV